ncbi:MAG: hypothetical protein ACRYFU_20535 [Janthinobacterium lividum]
MPLSIELTGHCSSRSRVRLMRVAGHEARHDFEEWTLEIMLAGDITETCTDELNNIVTLLAGQSTASSIEAFACELTDVLLNRRTQIEAAEVSIAAHLWKRLTIAGKPDPTALMKGSDERQSTRVRRSREGSIAITSGFEEMRVLKTAPSRPVGALEESATLPGPADRLFSTVVAAEWPYSLQAAANGVDFNKTRHHLRERMIAAFARLDAMDGQQTFSAMAEAALQHTDLIDEVCLRLRNRHISVVGPGHGDRDLPNHVFVATDDPDEVLEATIKRVHADMEQEPGS